MRGAAIKRKHRLLELKLSLSREYQKIPLPLLSSTCSLAGTLHSKGVKKTQKTQSLTVPYFARCKMFQVDVKWPQLLLSVKTKCALLSHQARQEKEEDVLSTFIKKLYTCQLSSPTDGMRHRQYFLVSCAYFCKSLSSRWSNSNR